jgi:hypothetical protein
MKKILAAAAVITVALTATGAEAQHYRQHGGYGYGGGYHQQYRGGGNWVAPFVGGAIIGGVLGSMMAPQYYAPAVPAYRTECDEYPVYDYSGYFMGMRRKCYQVPNY